MIRPLIEKEVKDLIRDPRIWIPVVIGFIMLPVIGYLQSELLYPQILSSLTEKISVEVRYTGGSEDLGVFPSILGRTMALNNIEIAPSGSFPERAEALLVINSSSIRDLAGGERVSAYIIYKISLASLTMGSEIPQRISNALTEASRIYLASIRNISDIVGLIVAPSIASTIPYAVERNAIIGGVGVDSTAAFFSAFFIPFIMAIIILMILQYSATSMAIENEEKTLEVLLSMPIPRWNIVVAKLSASAIIGGLSVIGFVVGFAIYSAILFGGLSKSPSTISSTAVQALGQLAQLPTEIQDLLRGYLGSYRSIGIAELIMPSPASIAILATYIIGAAILAGILGIIIGGLSSDVRMSQTISGQVAAIVIISALATMYLNPKDIPGWVLLTNPLTGTTLYSKIAFSGLDHGPEIYLYLSISILVVVALIYIAGRILSLETLERARRRAQRIFKIRRH